VLGKVTFNIVLLPKKEGNRITNLLFMERNVTLHFRYLFSPLLNILSLHLTVFIHTEEY